MSDTTKVLKDFADAVEAYLVHGEVDLRRWVTGARLQAAIAEGDNEEVDFQRGVIARAGSNVR